MEDTKRLVKSILVAISLADRELLCLLFKNKLTSIEVNTINYKRRILSKINEGAFANNEITYLKQDKPNKLSLCLAKAFHKIYDIEFKHNGNDISNVKRISDKLKISINIYNISRETVYSAKQETHNSLSSITQSPL